ncbi:MAG: response regulator [Acidobacteria bacterium]|nr:response regulator [Acidobacteriota bacterium]
MSIHLQLAPKKPMRLARVLLADDDPTARLTLQTVLELGGYKVDSAASAAEAMHKLDSQEYSLVLTGRDMEAPNSGARVVEHAKMMDYRPATAYFDTHSDAVAGENPERKPVLVAPEDIPELLGQVADLISRRASRQVSRELRTAS